MEDTNGTAGLEYVGRSTLSGTQHAVTLYALPALTFAVIILSLYFTVKGNLWKPFRLKSSLPPGPQGLPVFGNLLQFRAARGKEATFSAYVSDNFPESLLYILMSRQLESLSRFGEMATLSMGTKTWVLLNSKRVVAEVIARRGNMTHERPYMPIASGLVSFDKRTVLRQTDQWVEGRRTMHHLLNGSALKLYGEWQELESTQMLAAYLYRPREWYLHHYRFSNSFMHRIVLGDRLLKSTPELKDFQRVTVEFIRSINASFIDFFPGLANIPAFLQPWRKYWQKMGQSHNDVFESWWRPVQQAVQEDTAPPSFVRDVLLDPGTKYTGDDTEAMYLATSIIAAGSDNTRMTMNTFVMSALCEPEVFRKARAETDKICGQAARLPCVDDMASMPYVCALVKEVLRWRPTVPIVPPHQLTQTLEFEGYTFPIGTEFVINGIAVSKDYQESQSFHPERWLDGNENNVTHSLWHFGGGRRICVGHKVAQMALFVAFARLVYCFDFVAVFRSSCMLEVAR